MKVIFPIHPACGVCNFSMMYNGAQTTPENIVRGFSVMACPNETCEQFGQNYKVLISTIDVEPFVELIASPAPVQDAPGEGVSPLPVVVLEPLPPTVPVVAQPAPVAVPDVLPAVAMLGLADQLMLAAQATALTQPVSPAQS